MRGIYIEEVVSGSKKDKKPESKLHRWWDKQDKQIIR